MNKVLLKDLEDLSSNFQFCDQIKEKTFLITGGTGLIGSSLIRFLDYINKKENLNIKIYATARNNQKTEEISKSVQWIIADIKEKLDITEHVDYVIHTACPTQSKFFISHPTEVIDDSVLGTRNILNFSKDTFAGSVVYLSSLEVYGEHEGSSLVDENIYGHVNQMSVRSCYPEAKRLCECMCSCYYSEYGVPVKVLRLTQTFGPGVDFNDNRVFMQFAKKCIANEDIELHTYGGQARSYLYINDAITAIFVALLLGENGQAYNAANKSTYISAKDMANFFASNFSKNSKVVINLKDNMGYAPETQLNLDTSKLENLGWKPLYNFKTMVNNLIEYIKSDA